jgi:type II secretory ATPase GspE/PulE/Tfp pilus assembly ATPase PilB-like protein
MTESAEHFVSFLNSAIAEQFAAACRSIEASGIEGPMNEVECAEILCKTLDFGFTHSLTPTQIDLLAYADHREMWIKHHALPFFVAGISMVIVHCHPWETAVVRGLRQTFKREISLVGVPEDIFETVLGIVDSHLYPDELRRRDEEQKEKLKAVARQNFFAPWKTTRMDALEIAAQIMRRAFWMRASDVHIQPDGIVYTVRFRINGLAEPLSPLTLEYGRKAIDGIKSMAGLRLKDRESNVGGRATIEIPELGKNIDLRIELQYTNSGEAVVVRLLDADFVAKNRDLPFRGKSLYKIQSDLQKSAGLILVTGPTGSGKSTTLYRCLFQLDRDTKIIRTIENPVEFTIPGIAQLPTGGQNSDGTFKTFANLLRSHMRADPDVILVGEIRDQETAETALEAANTGHLVLSTLHTTTAVSTVMRIVDLGGDAVLLASNLLGVIAQRLVPKLCPRCRIKLHAPEDYIAHCRFYSMEPSPVIYRRNGCEECNFTGIGGRIPIFEYFFPDHQTRPLISRVAKEGEEALMAAWEKSGQNLASDGLQFVSSGDVEYPSVSQFERNFQFTD